MALDDDIAILAQAPLFALMGRDALRLISFAAERRTLDAGEELFRRNAATDGGYVVLAGTPNFVGSNRSYLMPARSSVPGSLLL